MNGGINVFALLCAFEQVPSRHSSSFPSCTMRLAWVVFQEPWALTLGASVSGATGVEKGQTMPQPGFSKL